MINLKSLEPRIKNLSLKNQVRFAIQCTELFLDFSDEGEVLKAVELSKTYLEQYFSNGDIYPLYDEDYYSLKLWSSEHIKTDDLLLAYEDCFDAFKGARGALLRSIYKCCELSVWCAYLLSCDEAFKKYGGDLYPYIETILINFEYIKEEHLKETREEYGEDLIKDLIQDDLERLLEKFEKDN
jgi:hypothetical protein